MVDGNGPPRVVSVNASIALDGDPLQIASAGDDVFIDVTFSSPVKWMHTFKDSRGNVKVFPSTQLSAQCIGMR